MNKQIISASELARKVIKTYEQGDGELITGIEFHNSENGRTKHRVVINGTLEAKLYMQHERMSPAIFSIYITIYDGQWSLSTTGYYDEVNVSYSYENTEMEYTFMQLREWMSDFVETVYQLKAAEVHGIVVIN
jgi:hypothetical protein